MKKSSSQYPQLVLRKTEPADLDVLFAYQADEDAAIMAAFMAENFRDRSAYIAKWERFLADETIDSRTILWNDEVAGSRTWEMDGDLQITYFIGRSFWGKGIAGAALEQYLSTVTRRPIYGRVAYDNVASIKVLEKAGFRLIETDRGYANSRKMEIDELVYLLEG